MASAAKRPAGRAGAAVLPSRRAGMEQTAAIAVIGDEILSGKYADENAPFAIAELRALGVRLRRIEVISDDLDDIAATVPALAARVDLLFTSGGVGPTHDDRTMAGIARGFGVALIHHPRMVDLLRRYLAGAEPTASQLRLAEVPDGAELLDAPGLGAPIVRFRNVHILPGVPSLFRQKLVALRDRLRSAPFVTGRLTLAVDETVIAERLAAVAARYPDLGFGSYPRFDDPVVHLVLTVEGKDAVRVEDALAELRAVLGDLVVELLHSPP
jgi:molybdenum cofactor synthesis domain-containing protein